MTKPRYRINLLKEAREARFRPSGNPVDLVIRMAEGVEMSLMLASRDPGYHTRPHYHDAEQINYILDGEIWFYVDGNGYRCVKGDVMRIPRNKIHWAWNRAQAPCSVLEAHSPPLTADQRVRDVLVSLRGPDEVDSAVQRVDNIHVDYPDGSKIEDRAAEESGEIARAF
jgi:quercetin dioxygenase-like cupin family protein